LSRRRDDSLTPLLSRWLDGRATPQESVEVERLLASDPAAAAAVERLREAAKVMRSASARVGPRPDLADRVLAAGGVGSGELVAFRRLARRYVAAAAVLLGIGVSGSLWLDRAIDRRPGGVPLGDPAVERIGDLVLSALEAASDEDVDR
jgi:anti-sigma factor RsiW